MTGDNMEKRPSLGSLMRRRLQDITNSVPRTTQPDVSSSEENYINYLVKDKIEKRPSLGSLVRKGFPQTTQPTNVDKENVPLVKIAQDKNKVVELSAIELKNMRIHLQRLQLQNSDFAQTHTAMLAELNLSKTKIKLLQHELACKEALLGSMTLKKEQEQRDQLKNNLQDGGERTVIDSRLNNNSVPESSNRCQHGSRDQLKNNLQDGGECMVIDSGLNNDSVPESSNRGQHRSRSPSMGHSTTSQQAGEKEAAKNKRRYLRRQFTSSKMQKSEPAEDWFELEGLTAPYNSPVHEEALPPFPPPDIEKEVKDCKNPSENHSRRSQRKEAERMRNQKYKEIPVNIKMRRPLINVLGIFPPSDTEKEVDCNNPSENHSRRSSTGRPSRKAVEKIQSYKEMPLHIKMRRP